MKQFSNNEIRFNVGEGPVSVTPKNGQSWTREDVFSHFKVAGATAKAYFRTDDLTLITTDKMPKVCAMMPTALFDELKLSDVLVKGVIKD